MQREQAEVAVIGAGVIGLAIAHRLASAGHDTVLIDPGKPGAGASYGNAGTIADYAVQPVGTPEVLRALPSLLIDRDSPLSIRQSALPGLAPWLLRFLRQSLPATARRNAIAIADLMATALPEWQNLAAEIGGQDLMQHRGCLYIYETNAALQRARADLSFRQSLGISVDIIDAATLAQMEPELPELAGAAFFPNAVFLSDPGEMMARLATATFAKGADLVTGKAETLHHDASGLIVVGGNGFSVRAKRVVIAAGAHSRPLARLIGDKIPLETERGYHAEWDMPKPRLSRPACPTARGFYLCPMQGRLRVAGTVELGGLTAPPSPRRLDRLVAGARAIFPDLGPPDRTWLGFRPSTPDSLPVIGPGRDPDVIHAYGHGHVGLTLAPVTARLVADIIAGQQPGTEILPCKPNRF